MNNNYIGRTKNGLKVYNRKRSHIHKEGGLSRELLREALRKIEFPEEEEFKKYELNLKRPIGETTCVQTFENDKVVAVYRLGRQGTTPMVLGRSPEKCSWITVILKKFQDDSYGPKLIVVTAFIGAGSKPEPWDRNLKTKAEREEAKKFWDQHALVFNPDLVDWERTPTSLEHL